MTNKMSDSNALSSVTFGDENVSPDEKSRRVREVFRSVANRYDLMNDLMSMGIHRIWKREIITKLNPQPSELLLDVAGGTGDIARNFVSRTTSRSKKGNTVSPANAVICDFSYDMLVAGQHKTTKARQAENINGVCGDAHLLPFATRSFDALSIAFGIRNVANREIALKEFFRVLKPAGRVAILEFGSMTASLPQKAYDAYSYKFIPWLGELFAKDRDSYEYLVKSIRKFPSREVFKEELEDAGFRHVSMTNYTGGIVTLYLGWAV